MKRSLAILMAVIVAFVGAALVLSRSRDTPVRRELRTVLQADLRDGKVERVSVDDESRLYVHRRDGDVYQAEGTYTEVVAEELEAAGIDVGWWKGSGGSLPDPGDRLSAAIVTALLAMIALGLFWYVRQRGEGVGNIFALRRTTARRVAATSAVRWSDVGGASAAKAYLQETLAFLENPSAFAKLGARPPRGILLEGPPGFGKTLLARAFAGEAKRPFFEVSASEFVELFVGVGASRVRSLFAEAKKKAPCIVFIDELDSVGRRRGSANASLTQPEPEQALNQLLASLDGFGTREGVVVLAATSRSDVLDPALVRPGRFDVTLSIGDFSVADRLAVLRVHTKSKKLATSVDLEAWARRTEGFSGAELEQLCNAAARLAVKRANAAAAGGAGAVERAEGGEGVGPSDGAEGPEGAEGVRPSEGAGAAEVTGVPGVTDADFEAALKERRATEARLDVLDAFMARANGGLSIPTAALEAHLRLCSGETLSGEILWADASRLKLETREGRVLYERRHIVSVSVAG
jgi:ATP-dependent Zn protease